MRSFTRAAFVVLVLAAWALPSLPAAQSELVISKGGDKEFHRPGCERIADGKGILAMTRAQASARGLKPHDGCDPDKNPTAGGKTPVVHVYVDGGKQYHKENCSRLGKDAKRVDLEEAGKKLFPCATCKPPVRKRPPRLS